MENCSVRVHTRAVAVETSRSQRITRWLECTQPSWSGLLRFSLESADGCRVRIGLRNYTLRFDYRVLYYIRVFTVGRHESIPESIRFFHYGIRFHLSDHNIMVVKKKKNISWHGIILIILVV